MVEELVKTFQAVRGDILAMGRAVRDGALEEREWKKKRKYSEVDTQTDGPSPRKTRSQTQHGLRVISDSVEPEELNGLQDINVEGQLGTCDRWFCYTELTIDR